MMVPALAALAQQPSAAKVIWPRVTVNYTALDRNGDAVHGITADDLTVKESDRVARVLSLKEIGDAPASVCILVDASGSGYDNRATVLAELNSLRELLPAQDEVCLVDFSAHPYLDVPFTMDHSLLDKAIPAIKFNGGSAVIDAVGSTANYLVQQGKYENRVLVLISDGGENASTKKESVLSQVIGRADGPAVYALVERSSANGRVQSRLDRERIERWTTVSGGLTLEITDQDDPRAAIQRLIDEMAARLRLEIEVDHTEKDGKLRSLSVQLSESLRKQKITLVGPRLLRAPQP